LNGAAGRSASVVTFGRTFVVLQHDVPEPIFSGCLYLCVLCREEVESLRRRETNDPRSRVFFLFDKEESASGAVGDERKVEMK
jgi:hypothetical protein